jgi:hypothetical protein
MNPLQCTGTVLVLVRKPLLVLVSQERLHRSALHYSDGSCTQANKQTAARRTPLRILFCFENAGSYFILADLLVLARAKQAVGEMPPPMVRPRRTSAITLPAGGAQMRAGESRCLHLSPASSSIAPHQRPPVHWRRRRPQVIPGAGAPGLSTRSPESHALSIVLQQRRVRRGRDGPRVRQARQGVLQQLARETSAGTSSRARDGSAAMIFLSLSVQRFS